MKIDINNFHKMVAEQVKNSNAYGDIITIKSLLLILSETAVEEKEEESLNEQ